MSCAEDKQRVLCDGEECSAFAYIPVALRVDLGRNIERDAQTTRDWLFVRRQDVWEHYCPACGKKRLSTLSSSPGDKATDR